MDTPPKQVNIELQESDVHRDMDSVISAMAKIRAEAKSEKQISDQQMDEYLHLTYRLASGIKASANENMLANMQKVARRIDSNPDLIRYDPMQDGLWKREEKEFVDSLDNILIAVEGDNFRDTDERHHIVQAIKYLAAGETFEEKERVYNSIVPFEGGVLSKKNETAGEKLINFFFGSSFKSETVDPLTLRVDADSKFLEEVKAKASERGYRNLRIAIPEGEVKQFKDENPGVKVIGKIEPKKSEVDAQDKVRKIVKNTLLATMPISYPILGALGQNKVKALVEYAHSDSNGESQEKHLAGMLLSNLGVNAIGGIGMIIKGVQDHSWTEGLFGVYMIAEQVVRIKECAENDGENLIPTIPGAIFNGFYNLFTGKRTIKGNQTEVEISLEQKANKSKNDLSGSLKYLERMAQVEVPSELGDNLVFGPGNNRYFGKKFATYLQEKTPGEMPKTVSSASDKKNGAIVLCGEEIVTDDYVKSDKLFCFKDAKYLVTYIGASSNVITTPIAAEIIGQTRETKEIADKLSKMDGVKYLRLRKYEGSKLAAEEVTA